MNYSESPSSDTRLYSRPFVLFLFWMFSVHAHGQVSYVPERADGMHESWRYTYFPELDGKGIRSMSSGKHGEEYWFALDSGILQYDGYHWTSYGKEEGLDGAPVTQVLVDESEHVYAATTQGVFEFSEGRWYNLIHSTGQPGFAITKIYRLSSGSLLCSSNQGILLLSSEKDILLTTRKKWAFLKDQVKMDFVEIPDELLTNGDFDFFSDVFEPEPGKLWLAVTYLLEESGDVLVMFERDVMNGRVTHYDLLSDLTDAGLGHDQLFYQMESGEVWIVNKANKKPALRFDKGGWEQVSYGSAFGDDEYSESITQTSDGSIWISGIGNLYCLRPGGRWVKYSSDVANMPQAHVELYAAGEHLWVYGHRSAVYKIDLSDHTWLTYRHLNFAGADTGGTEWFLEVNGGVVCNRQGQWWQYRQADGLISDPVRVLVDSRDVVWVIGSDRGVAAAGYLQDGKWINFRFPTLSWSLDYRDIFEADDGSVWLGGCTDVYMEKGQTGGLVHFYGLYDHPQYELFPSRSLGLDQQNVYGIAQSGDGKIWIGGTALNYFDGKQWHRTDQQDLNDFVNTVHKDASGRIYVGSRQHGLYIRQNAGQWQRFSTGNGLKSNNIISIATVDHEGEIWVATDKEISHYKGGHWITDVLPPAYALTYEGGSLVSHSGESLWVNHSPRAWKRRVYNGKQPDLKIREAFMTYRYRAHHHTPETFVDLYSRQVDHAGNTALFWSGKQYFNKVHADKLLYAYRLNEDEWSDFQHMTTHTFTGLPDGTYRFEVRAMDPEGNVDPTPAVVYFEVTPPVWKQLWFIALIGCFVMVLGGYQFQILRKRQVLKGLNDSLQLANEKLAHRNHEIQVQKESLEEAVKKIDRLSQAKVNFFTNITHEFRTPLSLIIGPIERLSESGLSGPETNALQAIIRKNAIRLQKLINQLLELRRIESGTLELMLEEADLVKFVQEIKGLFDNQAREKGIRYAFHADFRRFTMCFDKDKVEKILFNLLSNAFKYTPAGGRVEVSLLKPDDSHVQLMVADTGKGISPEILERLFERYTTDGLSAHYGEGTGIGLSYIKDLVQFHHGRIEVESVAGQGTRFLVTLPDHLKLPDRGPATSATYSIGTSLTSSVLPISAEWGPSHPDSEQPVVLVVEDNEDMRQFIQMVIQPYYRVLTAEHGEQALELLDAEYVDLVISDVMMPGTNGISLCQRIRNNPVTSHVPVVLLTALSENEAVIEGYECGADSYLTKPFSPELLLVRLRNLQEAKNRLKQWYADGVQLLPKDIPLSSFDERFLKSLHSILEQHAADSRFDVSTMCQQTNMSHMHFIRKVKHLTGKKPAELLKTYRLNQARQLLRQKKINVSEVGYMVGYDVPNSFTRAFKKEFGMSPTEYVLSVDNAGSC